MTQRTLAMFAVLFALLLILVPGSATSVSAQTERCFGETNQCIRGPIRQYWERNGGLAVFGFPISAQFEAVVEGRTLQVQWFERDRLEIQPNGLVTAGRLGVEYLEGFRQEQWRTGTIYTPDQGCIVTNPATGHQICGAFATYWRNNGGIERFGLPITGERVETLNGQQYTVQYFERRRFEIHGNQVLLGLLGREVYDLISAGPVDPCANVPASRSAAVKPPCGSLGETFFAAGEGFIPGESVGAYLTAPTGEVFGASFQFVADSDGVAGVATFDSALLQNNPAIDGIWAFTFEGVQSGHRAIAYFRILRP